MDVMLLAEAPHYTLPDHEDVVARRLQGGEATSLDFAMIGHSVLRPKGVVPLGAGPTGKVYVVTEGTLAIVQADGVRHVLKAGDSIFIPAGEARAVINESDTPATMIVITPPPAP